ncbi:hypothetical protein [Paraburkholderia sp. ZP32-5]|uniref:hypothetical protein n=1 Tax=Paraburkholderia sp. ZP32-5 TaxID=2883245 RepID=UPI001F458557|nr:hypothetical protein [Paraburkholderia sp. ZP32-5]
MLYLKNTLGGLSRSLTDSALNSFRGPHRWWKLALFAGLIVLPGGSVAVALFAWVEHRRQTKRAKKAAAVVESSAIVRPLALPDVVAQQTLTVAAKSIAIATVKAVSAVNADNTTGTSIAIAGTACQSRGGASSRAGAGKLARRQGQQSKCADARH